MLTLLIAVSLGLALGTALHSFGDMPRGWSMFCGIIFMLATQLGIGLYVRRKVNQVNAGIQVRMTEMQRKLQRKVEAFQRRPGASVKAMQGEIWLDQVAAIRGAISALDVLNKYRWFNLMLSKQLDTMRMVMYYQIKEFDMVDKLMPNTMMMAAQAMAMKMARMYHNNDPKLDAFFRKKSKRLKGDDVVLIYSLYAWIKLKQEDSKAALDALNIAVTKSDNPVLVANRERVVNGKVKQFSNAQLGDSWYGLYLEEPKVKQQRMAAENRRF